MALYAISLLTMYNDHLYRLAIGFDVVYDERDFSGHPKQGDLVVVDFGLKVLDVDALDVTHGLAGMGDGGLGGCFPALV